MSTKELKWKTGTNNYGQWVLLGNEFIKTKHVEDFLALPDDLKGYLLSLVSRGGIIALNDQQKVSEHSSKLERLYQINFVWKCKAVPEIPIYTLNYKIFKKL